MGRKARRTALNRETRPYLTLAEAVSNADEGNRVERYVKAYLKEGIDKVLLVNGSAFNVSVVTLDRDFGPFVKKSTLIASQLAIGHDSRTRATRLYGEITSHNTTDYGWNNYYINCPALADLSRLLLDAEPLIRIGKVAYVPTVYTRYEDSDRLGSEGLSLPKTVFDLLLKGGRLTQLSSDISLGSRLTIPLMRLNLPILENVSLRDYSKILTEESEAHSTFSDYLRSRLLELDGEDDERAVQRGAAKIDIELRDGLRASRAEMEKLTRRKAVQATGATVAFCAATLVAVAGPAFTHYVGLVGASGGALGLAAAANEYVNDRSAARLKPFYFLWLLERETLRHDSR
jgi:hypothetical protein